jgi:hypothetical protein
MQEAQTQTENTGKYCGKNGGHRGQRRGRCGSSHARATAGGISRHKFCSSAARGEIDTAEFEEKRRLIANA